MEGDMVDLKVKTLNGMDASLSENAVEEFRGGLSGPVNQPDDETYDESRSGWNGNIVKHPALIVQCRGVADVIDAVNFAR